MRNFQIISTTINFRTSTIARGNHFVNSHPNQGPIPDGGASGSFVGAAVGFAVGVAVGFVVGVAVGFGVGVAVGLAVGVAVGVAVGETVADGVLVNEAAVCVLVDEIRSF